MLVDELFDTFNNNSLDKLKEIYLNTLSPHLIKYVYNNKDRQVGSNHINIEDIKMFIKAIISDDVNEFKICYEKIKTYERLSPLSLPFKYQVWIKLFINYFHTLIIKMGSEYSNISHCLITFKANNCLKEYVEQNKNIIGFSSLEVAIASYNKVAIKQLILLPKITSNITKWHIHGIINMFYKTNNRLYIYDMLDFIINNSIFDYRLIKECTEDIIEMRLKDYIKKNFLNYDLNEFYDKLPNKQLVEIVKINKPNMTKFIKVIEKSYS